jgi:endonuclease/exonuclease/phosphatase (EEP) superfamily protein YafD
VASAIASWALASRYLPIANHVVLLTAALSPYLMPFAAVSAISLALARRWILTIVAFGLTATTLAVEAPLYRGSDRDRMGGVELRFLSANLREGKADPGRLVSLAREHADVLSFQELTRREVDRLSAAGLDATFPYRWLDASDGAFGVGVWSRFPMHTTKRIGEGYVMAFISAQLQVPGMSEDPTVVVVHMPGPWPWPIDDWRRDLRRLPHTLLEVAEVAGSGAVVVAGDLNSTMDMRPFRALLRNGYRDAAEQSGAGILPTFPADWRLPAFLALDHILTRSCTAMSLRTIMLPGSDHRALVATVKIPR